VELEKITSFYVLKEKELFDEVDLLLNDVASFEEESGGAEQLRPPTRSSERAHSERLRSQSARSRLSTEDGQDEDSDDEGDEETGLTTKRRRSSFGRRRTIPNAMMASTDMTASTDLTRSLRRYSTTYDDYAEQAVLFSSGIMLKKRMINIYVQLCELKSYIQLNRTGFSKVLKKFDKIIDRQLRPKYMNTFVDTAHPFRSETTKGLEEKISKIVAVYTEIVTQGDADSAVRDLRSHLREHVVWERNTVWRELIGMERRAEAASLGHTLLGLDSDPQKTLLQGDSTVALPSKVISTPLGRFACPTWLFSSATFSLVVILALFAVLLVVPIMEKPEQQNCLALLVFTSLLWATEAIPLFVTSLTIPFLCVVLQVFRDKEEPYKRLGAKDATDAVFAAMWTPVIMLLLGGFTLAAALSKCNIDKRIATFVLSKAGTEPKTVLIANMAVAAVASMLISNVAAPVLCFGIIEVSPCKTRTPLTRV
jgi:phosphate transporter